MKRILIMSRGAVGTHMSSPGIRAYYMAQVLAKNVPDAQVTLAVPNKTNKPRDLPGVRVVTYRTLSAMRLIAQNDIIITSAFMPNFLPFFKDKLFVADLFSQYFVEWMELTKSESSGHKQEVWMDKNRAYLAMQLTLADFILCANERQRDSYIGSMSALGLIDPQSYDKDDSLRRYIDIAPHGVRAEQPEHTEKVVKGVFSGIRETDKLLIWNGGTVAWYDPTTFLHAMHEISKERDDIKALFLGTFYPDLSAFLGYGERFQSAFQLAKDLGLYQRTVFFEFGWVPHRDVQNYLIESDIGVCTYFDTLETHFSHRTRFVDLFWAELPIICTHGDILAQDVEDRQLGIVVPESDATAVANAIRRLADDTDFYEQCRQNLRAMNPCLSWDVTLQNLVRFCTEGESSAVSKADRFLPLLSRVAEYMLLRVKDRATPRR
jgi:glycosyltransferase involved in cell wall biosynthesis